MHDRLKTLEENISELALFEKQIKELIGDSGVSCLAAFSISVPSATRGPI